jgi:hypothetical protein
MNFQYETEIEFNEELCSAIITLDNIEYEHVPGSYSYNAVSDRDYYGYTNLYFTVKSVEVEKQNGSTFYTNSKNVIKGLISDKLYASIYDWLLDQMRK